MSLNPENGDDPLFDTEYVCPICREIVHVRNGKIVKDCRCAAGNGATKE